MDIKSGKVLYLLILFSFLTSTACSRDEEDYLFQEEVRDIGNNNEENNNDQSQEKGEGAVLFQKYMSLTPVAGGQAQGSASYGDYFFQGYNYNSQISIYNLKEKHYITTIPITEPAPSSRCHVNTMNFGCQRYSEDDFFPILYVCSGYPTNGTSFIYGYRIIKSTERDHEEFSISLVQTFSLSGFGNWTEGIIDAKNGFLWIKYGKSGYCYAKYKLPLVNEGNVTINENDSRQEIQLEVLPKNSSNQGHLFTDDKILLVSGVPSWGEELAFISINTLSGEREYVIDLKKIGLINPKNPSDNTFEPEGVIIYDGQIMICYRTSIYSFNVEEAKKYIDSNIETSISTIKI